MRGEGSQLRVGRMPFAQESVQVPEAARRRGLPERVIRQVAFVQEIKAMQPEPLLAAGDHVDIARAFDAVAVELQTVLVFQDGVDHAVLVPKRDPDRAIGHAGPRVGTRWGADADAAERLVQASAG
ncbi:hypothetical protein G6F63_015805 [Rhizopus arrhizus]|nr:hypothetical protein G6F63_015805 [Rhizopus arrhizus]